MAEVFDLTEHCQVAIRYNTGAYPDAHSLTVHIHDNEDASKARKAIEEGHAPHPGIDVIDALKRRRVPLQTKSRVDVDSIIGDLAVLRDDLIQELEAMWPGVCREVYAYYPEHDPFKKRDERMMVKEYRIRDDMEGSTDRRTVEVSIEFRAVTTLEEYQRFMLALSDGAFHFKRTSELGE
jgi:hypothetical protein